MFGCESILFAYVYETFDYLSVSGQDIPQQVVNAGIRPRTDYYCFQHKAIDVVVSLPAT